ncbi:hypothetical protein C6P46_001256 [Rhodotorula mucilaginosa]|uniref:HMG box domain-containing protein n=1 Tax=Rhodotorula mucilaginosa TaxID=5537 RepID=A0A9P6VU66_RHOMI|nr:hypothetical protein C6P46_001256 [Rhodotorula mucilaginosa]
MLVANLRSRNKPPTLEIHDASFTPHLASPPDFANARPELCASPETRLSNPLPIPIGGPGPGGRSPSSLRSPSARHQPYPTSPASAFGGGFVARARSATSASETSGWESESSSYLADVYGSSVDSCDTSPSTSSELSRSAAIESSPFVVGPRVKTGKDGRPAKSHTRRLDPGYIKRPPNAFILFRSHCCAPEPQGADAPEPPGTAHARHLASLQLSNSQHVSVIVSQVWKTLSAEDKAYWEEKARLAKEEHQRLHPDYRYRPKQRPKGAKGRQLPTDLERQQEQREACKEVARQVLQLEGITLAETTPDDSDSVSSRKASRARSRKKRKQRKEAEEAAAAAATTPSTFRGDLPADSLALALSPAAATPCTPASGSDLVTTPEPWIHPLNGSSYAGHFDPASMLFTPPPDFAHEDFAIDPNLATATATPSCDDLPTESTRMQSFYTVMPSLLTPPTTAPPTTFILPNPTLPPHSIELPAECGEAPFESYDLATPAIQFNPASPFSPCVPLAPLPSPTESASLAGRRGGPLPSTLLSAALQRRRSTVKPTAAQGARGDLMLISPVLAMQDGRRQSLGFASGLRRLSAANRTADDDELPTPRASVSFPRGSISAGILSATESFETFTFPQSVLESLPAEDLGFVDLYSHTHGAAPPIGSPAGSEASLRSSNGESAWSAEEGVERMTDDSAPLSFLDRRRSTLVPIRFTSPFGASECGDSPEAGAGANSLYGFHIGATDLFGSPAAPLPSGLASAGESPQAQDNALMTNFGSPNPSYFPPNPPAMSESALLPSAFSPFEGVSRTPFPRFPDVPVNVAPAEEAWCTSAPTFDPSANAPWLQEERRHDESSAPSYGSEAPPPPQQHQAVPEPECQYVYLTLDQLEDTELMTRIHQQGYGIAFDAGSLESPPNCADAGQPN